MRKWLVLLCLLVPTLASAQTQDVCTTSPCLIQANKPFDAKADHDGVDTTFYRLYLNGAIVATLPVSALQTGVITFSVSGLQRGTYVLFIEAMGDGGTAAGTDLTLNVQPGKPKPPTSTRTVQVR